MKNINSFLALILINISCMAQQNIPPEATEVWDPEPRLVTPAAKFGQAPSDAIVLFDGSNTDAFQHIDGSAVKWTIENGVLTVKPKTGDIRTKEVFGDVQLHIEFSAPDKVESKGQGRGNSGVFFMNRYEVQMLDSYNNRTYSNGQAGAVYKQNPPLVNAMRSPLEWNVYDIIFHAPVFNKDGHKVKSATVTVLHNGVLVQDHFEILGTTEYIGFPKNTAHGEDFIKIQDHDNFTQFRNIWIRKL